MDDCYKPYLLKVVVSDDANDGFHPEFFNPNDISLMISPHDVLLYVFTKDTIFLGSHRTIVDELIELPYKEYDQIFIATVATAKGEPIETLFSQFEKGKQYNKTDLLFTLTPLSKNGNIMKSPTDFMYASDNFKKNPYNNKNIIYYLYLEPRIGAVKIITRGLEAWADSTYGKTGLASDEFTFLVGSTLDSYNIKGDLFGNSAQYVAPAIYHSIYEVNTPMFNLMPNQTSGIRVYIYRNGKLIYPSTERPGMAYRVFPRSPYIIIIDFNALDGGINVIPTEFDSYIIHVEF